MKLKKLALFSIAALTSICMACATTPPPDDALKTAADAIGDTGNAEECAAQTYALAKKALEEAQAAAKAGNNEVAKQKALLAQSLAKQAKEEAAMNAEECERMRNAKANIEEKLQETPIVVENTNSEGIEFRVVYFDFDESVISTRANEAISFNVQTLKSNPSVNVTLAAHTDDRGTAEYNIALSQKRGDSVKQYVTSLGIEASRLSVVPYGKEMPVAYGSREQDYALNRRVEFVPR